MTKRKARGRATRFLGTLLACAAAACGAPEVPGEAPAAVRGTVEVCGGLGGPEKQECYETRLLEELDRSGVGASLEMLEAVAEVDRDVARDGHVYTHAIGLTAYDSGRPVAEAFGECTVLFQSGCYHGVIQAHFLAEGAVDGETIRALCEPYKGAGEDRWLLFQCLHGLGHGLTMFYGHHLPRALEDCDLLTDPWDEESCYGGAFMENVVNATNPHHMASEMAAEAGASGETSAGTRDEGHEDGHEHAMPMAEDLEPWEPLRAEDPHYPCSVLEDRYQRACYMMQTSVMLWHNGGDVGEAAESCADAPEPWRATCFQSLGRDVSSKTLQDQDSALRDCQRVPEDYRAWCYVGLVKNFVDLTATTDAGFEFCRKVEDFAKPRCNEAMGEEIGILFAAQEERRAACQAAETFELVNYCLRGARVPTG